MGTHREAETASWMAGRRETEVDEPTALRNQLLDGPTAGRDHREMPGHHELVADADEIRSRSPVAAIGIRQQTVRVDEPVANQIHHPREAIGGM